MRPTLLLVACAMVSTACEPAAISGRGFDAKGPDAGQTADANGVSPIHDGATDSQPAPETTDVTTEPPKDNIFVQMVPGQYVEHGQSADYFYVVTVEPLQTIPYPGACPEEAIARIKMMSEEEGHEGYPSCLESDGSLSLSERCHAV